MLFGIFVFLFFTPARTSHGEVGRAFSGFVTVRCALTCGHCIDEEQKKGVMGVMYNALEFCEKKAKS